jgi:hypothetical protein
VSEPLVPLDPRVLDTLRAERPAPQDARDRARARLEGVIPGMRRGSGGGGDGPTGGGAGPAGGGFGARGVGLAGLLLGGATGAALVAALARTPPARVVYVDRPISAVVVPAKSSPPPATPAPVMPPAPTALERPVEKRAVVVAPAVPVVAEVARLAGARRASRLGEERMLLDEARAGLVQGDPGHALEELDLHRARFAEGLLAEEREAMQVEALVRLGRYDEARERAGLFRARSAGSLFMPTVESAIESIP